jgi:hypothetical protein
LADHLDKLDGLRGWPYVPGQINPPAVVVVEVGVEFDATMARGSDQFDVRCRLIVGGDFRAAQDRLDDLVSQLKGHVDGDLGGQVDYARMTRIRGDSEGQVDVGGATFHVVDFDVEIVVGDC